MDWVKDRTTRAVIAGLAGGVLSGVTGGGAVGALVVGTLVLLALRALARG